MWQVLAYLRQRWNMPSQAPMCERKLFPKPCPSEAPFTNPAMSITCKKAGTLLEIRISYNYNYQTGMSVGRHSFNWSKLVIQTRQSLNRGKCNLLHRAVFRGRAFRVRSLISTEITDDRELKVESIVPRDARAQNGNGGRGGRRQKWQRGVFKC